MREFYAEWIEENMALYKEGSEYELYFVLNEDGSIYVSENAPYYGDIGLAGYYTKESMRFTQTVSLYFRRAQIDIFPWKNVKDYMS